jgi:hypothetical protein
MLDRQHWCRYPGGVCATTAALSGHFPKIVLNPSHHFFRVIDAMTQRLDHRISNLRRGITASRHHHVERASVTTASGVPGT